MSADRAILRPRLAAAGVAIGVTLAIASAGRASADPDTTPPTGSIVVAGDAERVGSSHLVVTIAVSDDATGVARIELSNDGAAWQDVPVATEVDWTLPTDGQSYPIEGTQTVHARFTDGAGNVSSPVTDTIIVDRTGPSSTVELLSFDTSTRVARFSVTATDPAGIGSVLIFCQNNPPAELPFAPVVEVVLDASMGADCVGYGLFSLSIWVLDGLGNGTRHQEGIHVPIVTRVEATDAVTGQSFTIGPNYPDGYTVPPSTVCRTEFRWGSDASLFHQVADHTFGGLLFEGRADQGYCGAWTFTLPWVPFPQFDWTFTGPEGIHLDHVFTARVGSTDPHFRSSNIPLAYVLPSTRELIVGEPVTYALYRLGGAGAGVAGRWNGYLVGSGATSGTEVAFHQTGGSTFTIVPSHAGDWFVGWDSSTSSGPLLAAYYDPKAKRVGGGDGGGATPSPTAPSAHVAVGVDGPDPRRPSGDSAAGPPAPAPTPSPQPANPGVGGPAEPGPTPASEIRDASSGPAPAAPLVILVVGAVAVGVVAISRIRSRTPRGG